MTLPPDTLRTFRSTSFVVVDYCEVDEQVDVITVWFPFVTPTPGLAWRLPLTVFSPERLFARIARNLAAGGTFFMVNQGTDEADVAADTADRRVFVHKAVGSSAAVARPAPSSGRLLVDDLAFACFCLTHCPPRRPLTIGCRG